MKRHVQMVWAGCAALLLLLGAGRLQAAASTAETRDWNAACRDFQDASGPFFAALAESKFAAFISKYPNSEHYAEAIAYQARAQYQQGKYDSMIELLAAQWSHAGNFADQFAYLTAEAWEKKNNYAAAAENFARLAVETPNSPLRSEAIFREAEAHAKLGLWKRVVEELGQVDGPFQQIARTNKSDDLVVRGQLLLSQAHLEEKDYKAAEKVLSGLATEKSNKELEWDRLALLCRVLLADEKANEALQQSTNLLAVAGDNARLKAGSIMLQGVIHESRGDLPEAIRIYETNLSDDLPTDQRREAMLRIVDLLLRQGKLAESERRLNDYLTKYPDEKGSDLQLLLLGELRLREYYQTKGGKPAPDGVTNLLPLAEGDFQKVLQFTNSPYAGKAQFNLGWCFSNEGRVAESQAAFSNAVARLGFGEDQAQARFKLADILYDQKNYATAVSNYWMIIEQYPSLASVKNELFEKVLYQIVRANLDQGNVTGAEDAMHKILEWFPNGVLGDPSLLLVGQAESPARAREVFSRLIKEKPQSSLIPEVKLAIARTYEKEGDWNAAAAQYKTWLDENPNNPALPRAEFYRASAVDQSGDETNASILFSNYVARFQSNSVALENGLPAQAQFRVADYFWRQGDYQKAELSYEEVFNKWPDSKFAFPARINAGKAALRRKSPQDAIAYITNQINNPNPELRAQALFALADDNTEFPFTSNHSNYVTAIGILRHIATTYTNDPIAALAWGRLGSCYYTLAGSDASQPELARQDYEEASKAFEAAMNSDLANVTTRSMAEFQLGQTLSKMSALNASPDPKLLLGALDHWENILYGNKLRDNEKPDMAWVEEAGREAGKLAESLQEWSQATQIYQRLFKAIPSTQNKLKLENSIEKARQMQAEKK